MKKFFLILMLIMSFTLLGENFTGSGEGYLSDIQVSVQVEKNTLKNIKVTKHEDTPAIAEPSFEKLSKKMIETQSVDIDSIAGATYSSEGFIIAVKEAVKKSGASLKAIKTKESKKTVANMVRTDIVVIGGGGAGITAAIEAREKGANVILIEKMSILGGNTLYATGGMNASGTKYQSHEDNPELHFKDTMKGGYNVNDKSLVQTMVEKSAETVYWLMDRGVDLSNVGRAGGASVDRIHRPTGGDKVGPNMMTALEKRADEIGVDIRKSTEAVEIVTGRDNKIRGIIVEEEGTVYSIKAKAVILATGGFGANSEMFARLNPALKGFGSTNHPGATGDAFDLITQFDPAMVDMEQIQTHPTVVPVKNNMITEGVRGAGAILVNRDAKRFIDELETRDVVSKAELNQEGQTAFLIFDQGVREYLKAIEGYSKMGLLTEANTLEELADKIDLDPTTFKETVEKYNGFVKAGKDNNFGRTSMKATFIKAPYYAVEVGPAVHHTMGGVKIDTKAQVYNNNGDVIKGLFAAGEVTGGIHGGNRLGGNAITDITVFGRIAGDSAVQFIKN